MQNNVTELTQKLLRSLDSNYNVIDMPSVIEIISLLEKVTITKELLETTRLGKYVNQLRRNTKNDSLAKRAKDLVKKWRDMVLPDSNGQIKPANEPPEEDTVNKKRQAAKEIENPNVKRMRINGQNMSELEFSDNSNSSFKDVLGKTTNKSVIVINSDSNSSMPDTKQEPLLEPQQPKKRGRKKGSKNHKNLIEEAETSFSNKLNVSRGNAKVKTTQELLADLQIRNNTRPLEDLNERAAKLTERVSIIDQKLNANSSRYRNSKKMTFRNTGENVLESGVVSNVPTTRDRKCSDPNATKSVNEEEEEGEDDIIIVDDADAESELQKIAPPIAIIDVVVPKSLSVEEALALLPPIDRSVLDSRDPEPQCSCQLIENNTDFSVEEDEDVNLQHTFEFVEDNDCQAKTFLANRYNLDKGLEERVERLHAECIGNVNGNFGVGRCKTEMLPAEDGLYLNVVPNVNTESLLKFHSIDCTQPASENFQKYSISEGGGVKGEGVDAERGDGVAKNDVGSNCENEGAVQNGESVQDSDIKKTFREWHDVLETPSYNGEILKILPYVIID